MVIFSKTCLFAGIALFAVQNVHSQDQVQTQVFDGQWDMQLLCPAHMSKAGRVADAYKISFPVTIKNSKLEGAVLNPAPNSGLRYSGTLDASGKILIAAEGFTGNPKNTLGNSPSGTPYKYSLEGNFTPTNGVARRIEDRPCEARFTRL
jgi:hypothetical protein